ncbi:zinc finger-containing ubiquitin peptidase 1-like [Chironomus tepperi]|uniref:zinc finger-containing ubiquitin peptidase 1-like n=1 Tax=Chironomus tepperi TaxID=113505 RepID=UPI00391EFD4B
MSSNEHKNHLNGPSTSATNLNGALHSCEICGESGFTDEKILEHTQKCHVEGHGQCPFCGLTGGSSTELLLHVNQAHLDYLTPENELMSFIDDSKTPSCDSDSMSCGLSPSITEIPAGLDNAITNGSTNNLSNGTISKNDNKSAAKTSNCTGTNTKILINNRCDPEVINCNNNVMDDNNNSSNNNNCDNNGENGIENHGEGSPLRSQLGLKLKANKPKITIPSIPSPLVCLMCPYTTNEPTILEEHINRSHFDPMSPGVINNSSNGGNAAHGTSNHVDTLDSFSCPICVRCFENGNALELHVNHEHSDILSPAKVDSAAATGGISTLTVTEQDEAGCNHCPVCGMSFENMKTQQMELHIEAHFTKSPTSATSNVSPDLEKEARKAQEQREFEMLRAQYGMDDQGNFREQSAVAMQRAVYAGEMSVSDYYCRQVGLRAAESNGVDDGSSCTKSVAPRVSNLSASSLGVLRSFVCSNVDHYAASYGDRGWGCGYRNAQMIISSLYQNPIYSELLRSAIGSNSMPSISRLQKMVEQAWSDGFDVQGKEQLGCKLFETRKWIGATEIVTLFSWMRIECQLVDFHRPTALNGCHPDLFNYVLRYFEQPRSHTPPLYLQHQGHSRTIVGIEQKSSGLTLLILDPSHSPKQVASLGTSQDSLRLIRRGQSAMKAPQYQIVSVVGKIVTEEEYQASKIIRSLRIPPDR